MDFIDSQLIHIGGSKGFAIGGTIYLPRSCPLSLVEALSTDVNVQWVLKKPDRFLEYGVIRNCFDADKDAEDLWIVSGSGTPNSSTFKIKSKNAAFRCINFTLVGQHTGWGHFLTMTRSENPNARLRIRECMLYRPPSI